MANKNRGLIPLWRCIDQTQILNDWKPFYKFHDWVDLLLEANHKDITFTVAGRPVTIRRGEKYTSILQLAEKWHWSKNRVKRFLATLEVNSMCTTKRTNAGTIITIVNYGLYNDLRFTGEPTNEPPNEPTSEPQTIMINNDKKKARPKVTAEGVPIE